MKLEDVVQATVDTALGIFHAEIAEAGLAFNEFVVASQKYDWKRAEEARLRQLAHTEAAFDAFTRGCRAVEGARP